jgi:hypothetical protein
MRIPEPLLSSEFDSTVHAPWLMRKALKKLTYESHPVLAMHVNPVQCPEIGYSLRMALEEVI